MFWENLLLCRGHKAQVIASNEGMTRALSSVFKSSWLKRATSTCIRLWNSYSMSCDLLILPGSRKRHEGTLTCIGIKGRRGREKAQGESAHLFKDCQCSVLQISRLVPKPPTSSQLYLLKEKIRPKVQGSLSKVCPALPKSEPAGALAKYSSSKDSISCPVGSQTLLNELVPCQLRDCNTHDEYWMGMNDHGILLPGVIMPSPCVGNPQYLEKARNCW